MVEDFTLQLVVFTAAITGSFVATMFPYWQKLKDYIENGQRDLAFEKKYLGTAITSAIVAVAISITLFDTLLQGVDATATLGAIFIQTALTSFGLNRGANMLVSPSRKAEEIKKG